LKKVKTMGEFVGLIPEAFLRKEKKEDFLLWLLGLPVDIWTKKFIYMDWCKLVGVAIDRDDVDLITGNAALTWG